MLSGSICPVCGKEFFPTPEHVYRAGKGIRTIFFCSWSCLNRKDEAKHTPKKGKRRNIVIIQCTQDGKFIKEWESAKEIASVLGLNEALIRQACRKQMKHKGYRWKYKE